MPHRILGLDIGADRVKATVVDAKFRTFEVIQCVAQAIPTWEEAASLPKPKPVVVKPPKVNGKKIGTEKSDKKSVGPETGTESVAEGGGAPVDQAEAPLPPFVYAIDSLLKRPGMEYEEVVCSISGHMASTRILELPFTNRAKINQVLPFEIEEQVPFDMQEMLLTYQVLSSGKSGVKLLAAMVKKSDLEQYLKTVHAAGIDPRAICFSTSALAVAVKNALPDRTDDFAVVDLGKNSVDVVFFHGGLLDQVRTIPFGGAQVTDALSKALAVDPVKAEQLKAQVGRIFMENELPPDDPRMARLSDALIQSHKSLIGRLRQTIRSVETEGAYKVGTILTTGGGFRLPGLPRHLADQLNVEVEPFPTFSGAFGSLVSKSPETDSAFALSLGLALSTASPSRMKGLNFRIGSYAYHKIAEAVQGSLKALGIMSGILLALFIILVMQSRAVEGKRIAAIDAQIRQIYVDTFKQQPPPGDPVAAFKSQVAQTNSKFQVLGYLGDGNLRALDVLKAMSESIPKELLIDIKQFDLKQDFVKFEAITDTFQTVNKIEMELGKNSLFKSVNREDAKKTPDDKIKFKLTIHLLEKQQSKAGVTTIFKKQPGAGAGPGTVPTPAPAAPPAAGAETPAAGSGVKP